MLLTVVLSALLAGAGTASAHPTLLFTDPAADNAVPDSPQTITLVFNESVTIGPHAITVLDKDNRPVPVGPTTTAQGGRVISARPEGSLSPGTYQVRWQATGTDGDQVDERFAFAVGAAVTVAGTSGGPPISWLDAVLRWILFAGLAIGLGGAAGELFTATARRENRALPPVRSWTWIGVVGGLLAVVALAVVLITGIGSVTSLWQGVPGRLLLAEAGGFLLALLLRRRWTVAPLLVVAVAEGLRSHANVAASGWGAVLTGVHVAAVAVWIGALVHVARAALAWRRHTAAVRWLLFTYARMAAWVFAVVIATGALSAVLLVPLPLVLTTTYGHVLLVKLGLVAVAAGVALTARRVLRRDRLGHVATLVRVEGAVLVGVLAVSGVLVSTPPAGSQPPTPPAPRGPVLPVGTMAGQIGVSAAASDGQLVVRLSTPQRGDAYAAQPVQDYTLSGQLVDQTPLVFGGCGTGCFVAPVSWRNGDNVLSLRIAADGWRGGTVSMLLPWPMQPGGDDLARAVRALRLVDRLTVFESVTSDTTTPAPTPQQLELGGAFFADQEPYAAGTAPIAVRISRAGQPVRLALGYPAASATVALTLDGQGRIAEETLTDGTHLIHRRFVYPDND